MRDLFSDFSGVLGSRILREVVEGERRKGDVLVQLEDDDYKAQLAQATATVEAAKAALENNRRQRDVQDARIQRALAGIDQANSQIAACEEICPASRFIHSGGDITIA